MKRATRRIPGLRCERCGSDEFELRVSSDGNNWTVYLDCVHCPRVFNICRVDSYNNVSAIPSENEKDRKDEPNGSVKTIQRNLRGNKSPERTTNERK